ncbi:hypothetical protein FHEFKHOI_00404 [Candidatus Methanoperedenaceae archaeon GB50]|nr:hypothetical protein FHEFKHOI_00404 [Candidatus Methanoperedenaceae archaeon GB50]
MIPSLDLALLLFIVILAIATITAKDLLIAVMLLGAYSFLMAMVWVEMHSVDVGFTEAAVGAGASTAFLIAALSRTVRWEKDLTDRTPKERMLPIMALVFIIILSALFVYVAEEIPAFGDPHSPPNRYVKLFSLDTDGLEESLNQGRIPDELLGELGAMGFRADELPVKVKAVGDGEWDGIIVPDELHYHPKEQKYYFIKKEGGKLDVYRYAPIIRYIEEGHPETEVPNMVTYILADYRGYDTLGEETVIFTACVSVILLLRRRSRL